MIDFLAFMFVGFLAQLVDGALGMGVGVISSSILLAQGIPPALASASVNAAKLPTTSTAALSHTYHRYINWSIARKLCRLFSDERAELREDPVTGSLNGSLAQWFFATGRAKSPYVISQGVRVGRTGRLRVSMDADATVWVAGSTTICISGEVNI